MRDRDGSLTQEEINALLEVDEDVVIQEAKIEIGPPPPKKEEPKIDYSGQIFAFISWLSKQSPILIDKNTEKPFIKKEILLTTAQTKLHGKISRKIIEWAETTRSSAMDVDLNDYINVGELLGFLIYLLRTNRI